MCVEDAPLAVETQEQARSLADVSVFSEATRAHSCGRRWCPMPDAGSSGSRVGPSS